MNPECLTSKTNVVPVFDTAGNKKHEILLPEQIMPLSGKRGGFSDSGLYYKGAGTIYRGHLTNEYDQNMRLMCKTNIVYEKYQVCYPHLTSKFGIFLFPHQPIFTDLEGACGGKEIRILKNQKNFELSAIEEITNVISTGIHDHNIFVYRLKEVNAKPLDVANLIEYVLRADFNTAWDKNLWSDIYCYSYVRDIADWFVSGQLCHKLGTVYALLHSLYNSDVCLYAMLLKEILGIYNCERHFVLYFSALILKKYCPALFDPTIPDLYEITPELFAVLLKLLFSGKACCHLEDDPKWGKVREYYYARIDSYVKIFGRKVADHVYFKLVN